MSIFWRNVINQMSFYRSFVFMEPEIVYYKL